MVINKLKRVPIEDVENKLIISFQALKSVDPMLQNIYLDIACFFVGRKKKEVVNIMETCYTFVNHHIDILNKRCLLATNDEDELEMHDLLQDMGRNIARNESPDEPCLETLDLEWCESLEEVHMSIGSLERLGSLNLKRCKKLKSLPDTICDLRALKVLNISKCNSLEALPLQLGNIKSLTKLNAGELSVSKLPESIGDLTKLVELDLSSNKKLETLPDIGSGQIALSLQELDLSYSGIISLPSGLSQLSNLQSLHLSGCHDLLSIPKLPPSLKRISASYCWSLERLTNLSNSKQLEELDLSYCSGLMYIQGLEDLISIRSLWLEGCEGLTHRHLPKRLFKMYSEFGHEINVRIPEFMDKKTDPQWSDWIIESPYWTSESSKYPESTTMYAHLLPNESHNFMAIILCFQSPKNTYFLDIFQISLRFGYSVKNTTSGFIWSSSHPALFFWGSVMVIVPKSIFSVTDDDHRIELTTHDDVEIVGIHLLYNTETETIEDVVEKHVITSMH